LRPVQTFFLREIDYRPIIVTPTRELAKAGLASARFWFTDLVAVSLVEPERILEKIFFTPKDAEEGTRHRLSD
jgi:hypothetical protein